MAKVVPKLDQGSGNTKLTVGAGEIIERARSIGRAIFITRLFVDNLFRLFRNFEKKRKKKLSRERKGKKERKSHTHTHKLVSLFLSPFVK